MHETLEPFSGAPAATLILAVIAIVSLLALNGMPQLIERHLLRPYQLVPQRQWHTLVTSGFIHADLPHLLFNAFTFWAFGFGLELLTRLVYELRQVHRLLVQRCPAQAREGEQIVYELSAKLRRIADA